MDDIELAARYISLSRRYFAALGTLTAIAGLTAEAMTRPEKSGLIDAMEVSTLLSLSVEEVAP